MIKSLFHSDLLLSSLSSSLIPILPPTITVKFLRKHIWRAMCIVWSHYLWSERDRERERENEWERPRGIKQSQGQFDCCSLIAAWSATVAAKCISVTLWKAFLCVQLCFIISCCFRLFDWEGNKWLHVYDECRGVGGDFFAAVVVFLRIWCKTISYRSWWKQASKHEHTGLRDTELSVTPCLPYIFFHHHHTILSVCLF